MPRKKGQDLSTSEGKYYIAHPLDFAILERLPDEGAMLGWHVIAMPVVALVKELNKGVEKEGQVTGPQVTGRIVSMDHAGYVKVTSMLGNRTQKGWQRTAAGVKHYEKSTGRKLPKTNGKTLTVIDGGTPDSASPETGQTEVGGASGDTA